MRTTGGTQPRDLAVSKKKVQLVGGLNRQVDIEVNATVGGTIGTDILNADGTLFDPSVLTTTIIKTVAAQPPVISGITGAMFADIQALKAHNANISPAGAFLTYEAMEGEQGMMGPPGPIGPPGSSGGGASVPTRIAAGVTFSVPLDTQSLFTIPIELLANAVLDVSGYLVEVN